MLHVHLIMPVRNLGVLVSESCVCDYGLVHQAILFQVPLLLLVKELLLLSDLKRKVHSTVKNSLRTADHLAEVGAAASPLVWLD